MKSSDMDEAKKRLQLLLEKSHSIPTSCYDKLDLISDIKRNKTSFCCHHKFWFLICLSGGFFSVMIAQSNLFIKDSNCMIEAPSTFAKLFRPPENCDICINVEKIDRIQNISSFDFDTLYAKSSRPVIVADATKSWKALEKFNFEFFKDLYGKLEEYEDPTCQFFPYKTEFLRLGEVFAMKKERANLEDGEDPWYVGWSNCFNKAGEVLREYYTRPYFLPDLSENIALSWIFMGGPGKGAPLHIDNVLYPSWQAQIKGRKMWYLAPPPECVHKCKELSVIVEPGEIIVVDTNRWYHQTAILPGNISITIGAEFD